MFDFRMSPGQSRLEGRSSALAFAKMAADGLTLWCLWSFQPTEVVTGNRPVGLESTACEE